MIECPNCEFTCASKRLMEQHLTREALGITERKEKELIRKKQEEERKEKLNESSVPQ